MRYPIAALFCACLVLASCSAFQVEQPPPLTYARYTSETHNDFGVAYEKEGDLEGARRQYRKAVQKDPANHVAWANLGNVLARSGEAHPARDAYRQALALAPGYGPAVNNLAMTYLEGESPDPAMAIRLIEAHQALLAHAYREAVAATLIEARALLEPAAD